MLDPSGICFVAGTPVLLTDGTTKNIEDFVGDEEVWARPHDNPTAQAQKCRVVHAFKNEPKETILITFDNGLQIQATAEHPFFVPTKGWVKCKDLQVSDECVNLNGDSLKVLSKEFLNEKVPVYNIEVESAHTYFVGTDKSKSVLVHNDCTYARAFVGSLLEQGRDTVVDLAAGSYALATSSEARGAAVQAWQETRIKPLGDRLYNQAKEYGYSDDQIGDDRSMALLRPAVGEFLGTTMLAESIANYDFGTGTEIEFEDRLVRGFLGSTSFVLLSVNATRAISYKAPVAAESVRGGAVRAQTYSENWTGASLEAAIERHGGPNVTSWQRGGKIIYENPATFRQVVYDVEGNYFRILDPDTIGGMGTNYRTIDGRTPTITFKNSNGTTVTVPTKSATIKNFDVKGYYNARTHFLNID
jgi:hypothetical protein